MYVEGREVAHEVTKAIARVDGERGIHTCIHTAERRPSYDSMFGSGKTRYHFHSGGRWPFLPTKGLYYPRPVLRHIPIRIESRASNIYEDIIHACQRDINRYCIQPSITRVTLDEDGVIDSSERGHKISDITHDIALQPACGALRREGALFSTVISYTCIEKNRATDWHERNTDCTFKPCIAQASTHILRSSWGRHLLEVEKAGISSYIRSGHT
mmetsp:Transcript_28286/g.72153  ORF Transcript_28286/g.72153 Transcript_28286/m.72153 type:complete len:214 (+) Transcript_28286:496-1137(+)